MSLMLRVLSPEGPLLETQADSVRLPAVDGSLGVKPGHRPMVLALVQGLVKYRSGPDIRTVEIKGGLAQVDAHSVTVLADAK